MADENPDPRPAPEPEPDAATHREAVETSGEGGAPDGSPYRNLFVPLVVVPAMIVITLVLIFVLFGQIVGGEASIERNLQRVQFGGKNEREQALFHLVQQIEQNWEAVQGGEELPWPVEGDVAEELERVWEGTAPEDARFRYVLAAAQAQIDAPGWLDKLLDVLAVESQHDEDGLVRFNTIVGLGVSAPDLSDEQRARVFDAIRPFTGAEDLGLRIAAAGALQAIPGDETVEALRALLDDDELEVRGQAAVSLSHLGHPAGLPVLRELSDADTYDRARQRDETKFREDARVRAVRIQAVAALGRLGQDGDVEHLREMASSEPDLDVREAAMRAVARVETAD